MLIRQRNIWLACGLVLALAVHAGPAAWGQQSKPTDPVISLDEALTRARATEPTFVAALAASRTAALDRSIARSALLPSVVYHNSFLYTQPNGKTNQAGASGVQAAPRFIANNAVREYASQGVVSETIGLGTLTAVAQASTAVAISKAELEISRRGLTATVVTLFYNTVTAQTKVEVEQRAAAESASFVTLTREREANREAAHADVLKAELTSQQRERDLADAQLAVQRSRLDLGVLISSDPRAPYSVLIPDIKSLPTQAEVEVAAKTNNPELQSALASVHAADLGIRSARAAYLPDISVNYTYGIDAEQFAANGPSGARNLGYSAFATLDIPVWDWLATRHRIEQSRILRDAARVTLTAAQRTLIAQLEEFYSEAALAERQLTSLQLSVDTSRESLRLARLRYSSGEATVLEVVDAQTSLTSSELGLADGRARYQLALANLQLLTGTI